MKLKNILIVVKDMEKAKQFYCDLFGLKVLLDRGNNVIMSEGLVLQEEKSWANALGKDVTGQSNSSELYFEEWDVEGFVQTLEKKYPAIQYVTGLTTNECGKKTVRFYDLDGNLIEVGACK